MKKFWLALISIAVVMWLFSSVVAEEEPNSYVGDNAKTCKMCHKDQVAAWLEWPMTKTWDSLSDEEKKKDDCIVCHVTGFGEEGGFVSEEKTPGLVGVQCEACHGPAGQHMKVPMTDKDARNASVTSPTEETCVKCHKEEGNPNFKEFKLAEATKELADHLKE